VPPLRRHLHFRFGVRSEARGEQRLLEGHDVDAHGWIVVQEGRYRFLASTGDGILVRMVLSEYLACEVVWSVG
jgi:hypothetical protein